MQIWCSLSPRWTLLRLLLYYVPAWYGPSFKIIFPSVDRSTLTTMNRLAITVILIIYCLVGIKIWVLRNDIKLASEDYGSLTSASSSQPSDRTVSTGTTNTITTIVEPRSVIEIVSLPYPQQITIQSSVERTSTPRPPTPTQSGPPRQRRLSLRQYIIIPLLFFLALLSTWIAPTIYRVHLFYHPNYISYSLLLAVTILSSLRGFFNAVIFITMGLKGRRSPASGRRRAARASDSPLSLWLGVSNKHRLGGDLCTLQVDDLPRYLHCCNVTPRIIEFIYTVNIVDKCNFFPRWRGICVESRQSNIACVQVME